MRADGDARRSRPAVSAAARRCAAMAGYRRRTDLKAHRGRAFVHVGPHLPAELHALAHAMNEALGGRGHTFDVIEPVEADPDRSGGIAARTAARHAGGPRAKPDHHRRQSRLCRIRPRISQDALRRVPFSLATAIGPNETAAAAHWSVPQRHPFEDWSDARALMARDHPAAAGVAVIWRDQPASLACPDAGFRRAGFARRSCSRPGRSGGAAWLA